ncbi:MAG: hypothetical protein HOE90_17140 [Bacteriovoracaceae bacterium]|jgi:DnaK suppressor protein|nr:hypothetical protein [Bacteriovoracaceae bacterium]
MGQKGLKEKHISFLRDTLVREKERLGLKDIYLSDDFNLNEEDRSDEVDQANADVSNSERLRLRNRELFYSKKIGSALDRMSRGEYGDCEECGETIRFERLKARPTAELCINCKEESERDESSSYIGRQSKSLGKAINLVGII